MIARSGRQVFVTRRKRNKRLTDRKSHGSCGFAFKEYIMVLMIEEGRVMSAEESTSQLLPGQLGKSVRLKGHVQAVRDMGNLVFVVLRDRKGTVQLVADGSEPSADAALVELARSASPESAVVAEGKVERQPSRNGLEIKLEHLEILSRSSVALPVETGKQSKVDNLALTTMLDYRPLTVRNPKVRAVFKIQSVMASAFREFLSNEEFTEIHTPKIVSTGTEGGAQLFKLDYFGKQAYLAQSPQFYKQTMVGAFERVFEIGPVYRAEEHDTTRHLNEYVSMDVEMGFIESERDLMRLIERLIAHIFSRVKENCLEELALYGATIPEPREIPAVALSDAIEIINREIEKDFKRVKSEKRMKTETENPDTRLIEKSDLDPEGERILCQYFLEKAGTDLVFVTGYPRSARPFYAMPDPAPDGASTRSFDLLFRGLEITTGGQRIHEYQMLADSISRRGIDPSGFSDYLQCFKYGMPPHGGFAIGLERLVKQLLGLKTVKLAALFPRDRNRLTP